MKCSEKIKVICAGLNISIAELARRTGQSPQNLNGKLKRGTITDEELGTVFPISQRRKFNRRGCGLR